jgi:hypothetical protein
MLSAKHVSLIAIEASVVGVCLIILVYIFKNFITYIPNFSGKREEIEFLFVIGVIFHVMFEYTGINLWYSKEYCKLL